MLAAATRDEKNDGEITIWELDADLKKESKASVKHTLKGHKKGVTSLAFHPHEEKAKILVSGGADASVIVWDADTGKEIKSHQSHKSEVRCVSFFPDGHAFASGDKDGNVRFYDLDHHDVGRSTTLIPARSRPSLMSRNWPQSRTNRMALPASAIIHRCCGSTSRRRPKAHGSGIPLTYRFHSQPLTSIVTTSGIAARSRRRVGTGQSSSSTGTAMSDSLSRGTPAPSERSLCRVTCRSWRRRRTTARFASGARTRRAGRQRNEPVVQAARLHKLRQASRLSPRWKRRLAPRQKRGRHVE